MEMGVDIHRIGFAVNFSKMVTDPFRFREVAWIARYHVAKHLSLEGGWAEGAMCFEPNVPNSCEYHKTQRSRTPVIDVQYLAASKHSFQPVIRMDFTRWQLPPTQLKDDGFRVFLGVRWPKAT